MHNIFKMVRGEDGDDDPYGDVWHAESPDGSTETLLCSGEVFDIEGAVDSEGFAKCISKSVKRGGITCPMCLEHIRAIKAIRL